MIFAQKIKTLAAIVVIFTVFVLKTSAVDYTVNNNGTGAGTAGTLDWALSQAAGSAGTDNIYFSSAMTITVSNLTIPSGVNIDASNGYAAFCTNGPRVIIRYNGTPATIALTSLSNVTIKGLIFQGFALSLTSCTNVNLYGNWFSLDAAGTAVDGFPMGNWSGSAFYLTISNSNDIEVGGTACGEGNVFSLNDGSSGNGVSVTSTQPFVFTNNYLGTDKTGTVALAITATGAQAVGLKMTNCGTAASAVTISNNTFCIRTDAGNSGPYGNGLQISGTTNTNYTVSGNNFGVNRNGNLSSSIYISASGIRVDGTLSSSTFSNNVIGRCGFKFNGGTPNAVSADYAQNTGIFFISANVSDLTISNNKIGVDNSGANIGNAFCGIYCFNGVTTSDLTISNNQIGNNGFGGVSQFGSGIALVGANINDVTIIGNYIGVSTTGADIGNANDGIIIQDGPHNIVIGTVASGNYISFNKGRRVTNAGGGDPTYVKEPNAAIMMFNVQDVVIKNNGIGITPAGGAAGHGNAGGSLVGGTGIIVQGSSSRRVTIGGMAANEQNTIAYNSGRGIMVFQGADYVEMKWNSIYCNSDYGIDLNCRNQYGANATRGNNGYGCPPDFDLDAFTPPVSTVTGDRPAGGVVDVFGSNACASGACTKQGQYRYSTGTYSYPSANKWQYSHGSTMVDDISALVTGTGGDCNSSVCRTSEYSNCVDTPLPVDWMAFDVTASGASNHLVWMTGKEKNNNYFLIERSVDGENYEVIGKVKGAVNSAVALSYEFDDVTNLNGIIYYRIRQVDLNGAFSYSPIRTVTKEAFIDVIVSPVPNNGSFNVELFGFDGAATLNVTDVMGRVVYTTQTDVQDYVLLPVQLNVAPGVYLVSVVSGQDSKVIRITVE